MKKYKMSRIRKTYCRIFQGAFKCAIPVLPYRTPKVLDSVTEVPNVLKEQKKKAVLIVTDAFLHENGMLDTLKDALQRAKIEYYVYDKTVPNPTVANVEEARQSYLENACDALIGFGGGSSIDCAKAVGARIAKPRQSIAKMEGILKVLHRIPFLIAVPTTAGTGSETTVATVITDEKTRHKFPISDFCLIPKVAVLDPEVTRTLPPHITATTGMDALTHAVEAYIGRSTVPSTRRDAIRATQLIFEYLEAAYADGNNMEVRRQMLLAAYYAGSAFSKSYVGYCHAVAHSLGGKYNIPHGLANAVLLPYVLEAYGDTIHKKLKELAVAANLVGEEVPEQEAAGCFIGKIKQMNQRMGIPVTLSGIREEDIPALAAYADKEANPLYPVPVLMSAKELQQFYHQVME
ncbi:MAG: iron-containing alcohol dehydrogenase [Lachnospiraceae bacterium]